MKWFMIPDRTDPYFEFYRDKILYKQSFIKHCIECGKSDKRPKRDHNIPWWKSKKWINDPNIKYLVSDYVCRECDFFRNNSKRISNIESENILIKLNSQEFRQQIRLELAHAGDM